MKPLIPYIDTCEVAHYRVSEYFLTIHKTYHTMCLLNKDNVTILETLDWWNEHEDLVLHYEGAEIKLRALQCIYSFHCRSYALDNRYNPKHVFNYLKGEAVRLCPDYPDVENATPSECVWVLASSLEGTNQANESNWRLIKYFQDYLIMTNEELIEIYEKIEKEHENGL